MPAGLGAGAQQTLKSLRRRWRSSLQVRVVSTTLVVSAVVISLLGFFLMQQIASNLLRSAEKSSYTVASDGLYFAEVQPNASRPAGSGTASFMYGLVNNLTSSGSPGVNYGVAVTANHGPPNYWSFASEPKGLDVASFPATMVKQMARDRSPKLQGQFHSMPYPDATGPVTSGLLYGSHFGSDYSLYYFFPLTQLQQELNLVEQLLALVGVALVFLLAGIAWLVTRWVVVPVAKAAQGAQLLSTGNLDGRLAVRGQDEVSALARSFNEMAASLQEKMGELEELSQVQRQFVSDVSHELRTPLTTIRMASDLLYEERDGFDSSSARSAELLHSQLGRFESLLADLLEISRYDANAATLDAEATDICDVVRQSADIAQHLAERRGARIEFQLPAEPCIAEMDRRRVERILRNLLVNAVEHGEGRDVVVTSASDRDAVAVAVRDFGVGLAAGEEHLVFDRFWRADPARARTTGGTGLGLAIALEDARLHGGWLEAWGQPGRGSVFRLTLPREAGGVLIGSPLPLAPDPADPRDLVAQPGAAVPGVAAAAPGPGQAAFARGAQPGGPASGAQPDREPRTPAGDHA